MASLILDELAAQGVTARVDSLGVVLRGPRSVLTADFIAALGNRRSELHEALLERLRVREPACAPSPVRHQCIEPGCTAGAPSPTGKCILHARLAVPLPAGLHHCPRCGAATLHRSEPCLPCMAAEMVATIEEEMNVNVQPDIETEEQVEQWKA